MKKVFQWLFKPLNYFICLIILEVILEQIRIHTGMDYTAFLNLIWPVVGIELFIPILMIFVESYITERKASVPKGTDNESKQGSPAKNNRGFKLHLQRASEFLPRLLAYLTKSSPFSSLLVCTILVAIPVIAAQHQLLGRTVDILADMRYSNTSIESPAIPTAPVQDPIPETQPINIENVTVDPESTTSTEPQGFLTDPDRIYQLSAEDHNALYFETGPYAVTDWSDPNGVALTISEYITSLRKQNKQDVFDQEAPVSLQNAVSNASELEKDLIDSDDLDDVIDIRIDAYHQYPKYRLTKLLTANYQRYALEYDNINGSYCTIEYYYAQSVFWLFESLTFSDIDDYSTKIILSSIKMRYHDIAAIAPKGSINNQHATTLFQAFKILESSVFD